MDGVTTQHLEGKIIKKNTCATLFNKKNQIVFAPGKKKKSFFFLVCVFDYWLSFSLTYRSLILVAVLHIVTFSLEARGEAYNSIRPSLLFYVYIYFTGITLRLLLLLLRRSVHHRRSIVNDIYLGAIYIFLSLSLSFDSFVVCRTAWRGWGSEKADAGRRRCSGRPFFSLLSSHFGDAAPTNNRLRTSANRRPALERVDAFFCCPPLPSSALATLLRTHQCRDEIIIKDDSYIIFTPSPSCTQCCCLLLLPYSDASW